MGLYVSQSVAFAHAEGQFANGIANRLGMQVICDFWTWAVLAGACYQVRAGTITTPLVGDVPITDTRAELAIDAATGTTIIPVPGGFGIGVRLATGTLFELGLKSVATVSSAGTAFVPLPLKSSGAPATSTARVAAHAVTVTAELATTTLRHWEFANPVTDGAGMDAGLIAAAANAWKTAVPPVLVGPRCLYLQVGAATTGPSYYAHLDYGEWPTALLL
jgi:hypothetical protein